MKILVLNGPNLNLLGVREPGIYGTENYAALVARVKSAAARLGVEVEIRQSNHEGALVDWIQEARGAFDGIVINPAAYTHTSVAIALPAVEVHISDVKEREPFRQTSYAGMACEKTIMGKGLAGYEEALEYLANRPANA